VPADQKSRDNEEDIHPGEAALEGAETSMEKEHGKDGDSAHTVDIAAVTISRRSRLRKRRRASLLYHVAENHL
jgi:hypothetical protein